MNESLLVEPIQLHIIQSGRRKRKFRKQSDVALESWQIVYWDESLTAP